MARFRLWSAADSTCSTYRFTPCCGICSGLGGSGRWSTGSRHAAGSYATGLRNSKKRPTEYQHSRAARGSEVRVPSWPSRVFLLAFAFRFFLGRYEMVWNDHSFMVGVDYVDQKITLPLQWLVISACITAAMFVTVGRWKLAAWMALALAIRVAGPAAVRAVYVRPNEISSSVPTFRNTSRRREARSAWIGA